MAQSSGPSVLAAAAVVFFACSVGALADPPPEDAIRKLIAQRVDALGGPGIGMVVGLIGPEGRTVVGYGHRDFDDPRRLSGDTAFEIGSVGKVLTALVLADMVEKREVSLEDPVAKHLPGMRVPDRKGRSITLLDLATHTSGLPFMPDDLPLFDDPAAVFGPSQLRQFLAGHELTRDIGTRWEYSNLGYWLLGQALASRAAVDYETLLRDRVTGPLKMDSTAVLTPALKARLAVGHDAVLRPSPQAANVPMLASMPAAGGGIVSTVRDMLTLLSMAMGYENSSLAGASALTLRTRRPMAQPGSEQALGWVVTGGIEAPLAFHDGATLGYASSVAWDPRRSIGVVVLSNQLAGVGDIARHLLRPSLPLDQPTARRRAEIAVPPAVLDAYVGRYEAPGEGVFVVAREREFLTFRAPADWGLPRLRLRPGSLREFFAAELPLLVTFQRSADGRVSGALIHPPRGQRAISANRAGPGQVK
jgi:CubicO group peptidase (beta-lactamase class C family)